MEFFTILGWFFIAIGMVTFVLVLLAGVAVAIAVVRYQWMRHPQSFTLSVNDGTLDISVRPRS